MIQNKRRIAYMDKIKKIISNTKDADLIAEKLSQRGVLVPICPIGGSLYTYHPYIERVIRYQVTGIHWTNEDCLYDVECYENNELSAYGELSEKEFGVSYYLSRSAATKNTNVISSENAKHIMEQTKHYFKDQMIFEYSKKTHQGFFKDIKSGRKISLRYGLKKLMMVDHSPMTQEIINLYKKG